MSDEQALIDLINANAGQGDRLPEYVYADWLDDNGDPRAEAWRVLLEKGKQPHQGSNGLCCWWIYHREGEPSNLADVKISSVGSIRLTDYYYPTVYDAMNAAAIAWVRCHRDPDFLRETETVAQ